jgi:hypothetical protein
MEAEGMNGVKRGTEAEGMTGAKGHRGRRDEWSKRVKGARRQKG